MWPNPRFTADLVTFTKEILNGKLHFLCCVLQIIITIITIAKLFLQLLQSSPSYTFVGILAKPLICLSQNTRKQKYISFNQEM